MRKIAVIAGILVAVAAGIWWLQAGRGRQPPRPPDLASFDPGVVELVEGSREAVREAPGDPGPWRVLGMVYDANELPEQARDCYAVAIELDDADPRTRYHLGVVQARLGALEQAAGSLERAAELDPTYGPARWRLGLVELDRGDLDGAWTAFERATAIDPRDSAGWLGLARVHMARGEHSEAAVLLEQLIGWTTTNAGYAWKLLGDAYRRLGRGAQAEVAASRGQGAEALWNDLWRTELMAHRPGYTPRLQLAIALSRAGETDRSIELLEALRAEYPDKPTVSINLANNYRAAGRVTEAAAMLDQLLPEHAGDHRVHVSLAAVYGTMSQAEDAPQEQRDQWRQRALAHAGHSIRLNPASSEGYALVGDLSLLDGRPQDAIEAYLDADERAPGQRWRFRAAAVRMQMGMWEQAAKDIEWHLMRAPADATARLALAVCLIELERFDEAEAQINGARNLGADVGEALLRLDRRRRAAEEVP